ncbi:MAG TPA: S8 family serine peptidase [Myxococcales bacterium]
MAKQTRKRVQGGTTNGGTGGGVLPGGGAMEQGTTGRFLVLLKEDAISEGAKMLEEKVGLQVARSADFTAGVLSAEAAGADSVVFDEIGVAVVRGDPDLHRATLAAAGEDSPLSIVEPERIVYALAEQPAGGSLLPADIPFSLPPVIEQPVAPVLTAEAPAAPALITTEYLLGYRDAIDGLLRHLRGGEAGAEAYREPAAGARIVSEAQATWGLQATRVLESKFSGKDVKVAVLDTGFDTRHPDFAGRQITTASFVPGQAVQDGNGHGTHCIGTALGARQPGILPRYGIAFGGRIFAGKVLSNQGSGADGWILAGINWAIANGCRVVSMSLGAPVQPGQPFSQIFETVARRALAKGTLIVAAAGNESDRRVGRFEPVGHPANCPSILAVAAVDVNLRIAFFSNRGLNPMGGQVDIAAPGVDVYSSWPMPTRYRRLQGTSMATPHVAGIAALFVEASPKASASDIWRLITQGARRLPLPSSDVGAGLVQAP